MRLDDAYDVLLDFEAANTVEDIDRTITRVVGGFGVDSFLMGTMPPQNVTPEEQMQHVIMASWPDDWALRYFQQGYLERDPTIHHVRNKTQPIDWRSVRRTSSGRNLVMNEAGEFKLNDGITIPQITLDGAKLGVSFAGERIDLDHPDFRTLATMTASYAAAAALRVQRSQSIAERVALSPRELEALKWTANGLTGEETAQIMGITQVTVEKHIKATKVKLKAFTKAHAVAEALRQGLLN